VRPIVLHLRHQLLLALVAPAIVVLAVMAYFADGAVRRALEESLGERLIAVAEAAATIAEERVLVLERGDDASRVARSSQKKLEDLIAATGVERILIVTWTPERAQTLVDSKGELKIGDEYLRARFDRSELERVGRGESAASVLFKGVEGRWYKTGYAPLATPGKSVQAAVVVNAPARFFDAIDELRTTLVAIAVLGFLALAALASASARRVSIPLQRLSAAAERIGEGRLDAPIPIGGPKEAAVLSETMRTMARSIAARDQEMQLMLAGIAHEVRNPLGGIELFGGLLKEDLEPSDPRRKHVETILKEIALLGGVVNDFLDFARRRPLNLAPVEVAELIDEILSIAGRDAADKEIELAADVERGLVATLDRDQLNRAVLNLVRNAVQATPDKGRVRVHASRIDAGGGFRIRVEDTGPGVPLDKREEIWRPFFTTKEKGTGLGLALVKKAVDAHGGTIRLESPAEGGACFVIELPELSERPERPGQGLQ
jgi:signal transduction histidine kinase